MIVLTLVLLLTGLDLVSAFAAVVQAVRDDGALQLDFNHPLAGQPVTFEVHVIGIL